MFEAEKWREYQENYTKYGIDMEPARPTKREEPRKKNNSRFERKLLISPKERKLMLLLMVIAALCSVSCILVSAATSQVEYNINEIIKQQNEVTVDIDNYNAQIMGTNSMDYIEYYAETQLGMVYPSRAQYVYITETGASVDAYIAGLTSQLKNGGEIAVSAAESSNTSIIRQGNAQLKSTILG